MTKTVVLYPGLGVGHLTPMVELAKLILQHGVAVTVALAEPPVKAPAFSAAVARAAASNPSITFHVLPPPSAGSGPDGAAPKHPLLQMLGHLGAMNAPLRGFLCSLPAVDALVLDMFCVGALDVAAELELPAYVFYASGAGDLAVFLNLPGARTNSSMSLEEFRASVLSLPGAPPFRATDLPDEVLRDSEAARAVLRMFQRMPESDGILINTFESLETRAVRALRDGLCVPADRTMPPVYCIGPLVSGGGETEHECLRWLDAQPDRSVVFLSFSSLGRFPKKQLEEMAVGLEKSGQRFLWVVRSPPSSGSEQNLHEPLGEPDLDALLPEGFLERTEGRGLVLKSWAPQVDVLRHRATGAFVTHCGWNSTLEGIVAGLPLLCWPLYAEQRMNKVFIVEEMKVGVEMRGYDEEMVTAEEVETRLRWVMESEGGRALSERVLVVKDRAAEALKDGGSSYADFVKFLQDLESANRP